MPRQLEGRWGTLKRASLDVCLPGISLNPILSINLFWLCFAGEEMTALEKHTLFFCGSPEEAPHISTATLSFEGLVDRVRLLRGFEEGSKATGLGIVVLGAFGSKARKYAV